MVELCRGMVAAGTMRASEREIAALARNVVLVATYWMSFHADRQRATAQTTPTTIDLGLARVPGAGADRAVSSSATRAR